MVNWIGRVDILLEVTVMSKNLELPREGDLEKILFIMGYLNSHKKMMLMFDSSNLTVKESCFKECNWFDFYRDAGEAKPPNMPKARLHTVTVSCFVDSNHAGNQADRRSQTGILIFLNRSPIN